MSWWASLVAPDKPAVCRHACPLLTDWTLETMGLLCLHLASTALRLTSLAQFSTHPLDLQQAFTCPHPAACAGIPMLSAPDPIAAAKGLPRARARVLKASACVRVPQRTPRGLHPWLCFPCPYGSCSWVPPVSVCASCVQPRSMHVHAPCPLRPFAMTTHCYEQQLIKLHRETD